LAAAGVAWSKIAAFNLKAKAMQIDRELDVQGLKCPLPILRTKKTLAEMESGQVLHVLATDPGAVKDFAAFARQTGNELLEQKEAQQEEGQVFEFFLKRK